MRRRQAGYGDRANNTGTLTIYKVLFSILLKSIINPLQKREFQLQKLW